MGMSQLVTLMIVIQLWQTTPGADPKQMVQWKVKVCYQCNDRTADFNWTHPLEAFYRIQWKFKNILMASYTGTALDLSQEALRINQNYKGRFNLLKPGGVGFNLINVTRADIGTYRCIITLLNGVGETLERVLEEGYTDRQTKVEVCNDGNAIFKWRRGNVSFSLIRWQVNGTTIATTKTGFSTDSLDISTDYRPRFRLLKQGDVGFQLDHVSRNDAGTYTCIITSQSPEFTIVADLEVKDQQSGDFNIMVSNQGTLTCGESRDSTYFWWRTMDIQVKSDIHPPYLHLSPCGRNDPAMRQDVSAAEVPDEGGNNIVAVVVPIIVIIIIIIIIVIVIVLRKRRREREGISSETGGGKTDSGVEEQML